MKKLISILLLISMCVGMISCANSDEGNAENTSPVDTGDGEKNIVDRLGHLDYGEEECNCNANEELVSEITRRVLQALGK